MTQTLHVDTPQSRIRPTAETPRVPGEWGIWALIFTDLSIFACFFGTFAHERGRHTATFQNGRTSLDATLGAANTALLLTASLFVALAVMHLREGNGNRARTLLAGTALCGTGFIVNKAFEWSTLVRAGHTPVSDEFFQLYFILTGSHLLHVLIAMVVVGYLWRIAGQVELRTSPSGRQLRFIENSATYWHLVDLLWIVLFTILYLMH